MSIVATVCGQLTQPGAIRTNREDLKITRPKAGKCDQISAWRPCREVIRLRRELCDSAVVERQNPKPTLAAENSIHQLLAVRRELRKCVAVLATSHDAEI